MAALSGFSLELNLSSHVRTPSHSSGGSIPTSSSSCLAGSEGDESDDGGVDATTGPMRRLGLGLRSQAAAAEAGVLRRSASTASLSLSRVGSEGSDLSGYVVGADLSINNGSSSARQQQKQGSTAHATPGVDYNGYNNVVVVQLECPRCQCIDRRCVCHACMRASVRARFDSSAALQDQEGFSPS